MKPVLSILTLSLSFAILAKPTHVFGPHSFLVKNVKVPVLAWQPYDSRWSPVELNSRLMESTLVEVENGGSITLELDARSGFTDLPGDVLDVTLNRPIVLRLDEDVVRRVKFQTYFIPQVPATNKYDIQVKSEVDKVFGEAWDRFVTMMVKEGFHYSWLRMAVDTDPETSLSLHSQPINLLTPVDNITVMPSNLPFELRINWEKLPDPKTAYEVRVWRFEQVRPAPVALTLDDAYQVKLPTEGGYFVQVTSADGKSQSQVHRVYLSLPLEGRMTDVMTKPPPRTRPLPLILPPNGFYYYARELPTEVTFQWEPTLPPVPHQEFTLLVTDATGTELVRKVTREKQIPLRFSQPGEYHWYVSSMLDRDGEKIQLSSEVRTVHIEQKGAIRALASDLPSAIMKLIAHPAGVFYLEDGTL